MRHRTISKKASATGAALFAILTLVSALPATVPSVRVAAVMRLGFRVSTADRIVVDPSRHRGYYFARSPDPALWVLDLKRLRVVAHKQMALPDGPVAVDTIRHKIFIATPAVPGRCDSSALSVFDGVTLRIGRVRIPCDPASGPVQIDALSVDPPQSVLSLIGHRGSTSFVREYQVREEGVALRWEATQAGICGVRAPLITRMAHGTAAFCARGSLGRAIWIPTWHGLPVPDALGHPIVRVMETGPVGRVSALDGRTGRVAIVPGDGTVAVFDAPDERWVATIRPPPASDAKGVDAVEHAFDPVGGRLYLLRDGVLRVAEVRGDSSTTLARFELPSGISTLRQIAVDPRLHRLFIPDRHGLIAVDDDRPVLEREVDTGSGRATDDRGISDITHRVIPGSGLGDDANSRDLLAPTASGKAARDGHTPILRLQVAVVDSVTHRLSIHTTWPESTTLPFLVERHRRTHVPLRAPPAAA